MGRGLSEQQRVAIRAIGIRSARAGESRDLARGVRSGPGSGTASEAASRSRTLCRLEERGLIDRCGHGSAILTPAGWREFDRLQAARNGHAEAEGPVQWVADADPVFVTGLGQLYRGDCLDILPRIPSGCADAIFADPPFNLGTEYGAGVDDRRSDADYLDWCRTWLGECGRILKPGGAIFVYNLPKWNTWLACYLDEMGLQFQHWIPIDQRSCLPIEGRLYPAHYSLLYYTKGKPKTFRRIRTPIKICRHCKKELKDYGGHRGKMNPHGVNLTDVWTDIPPVRHRKFKSRARKANALSTKVLDRVVEMSTREGDLVLDPFGGSGTTYFVCERKRRRWIGIEIDSTDAIIETLSSGKVHPHRNDDFVED